MKRIIKHIFPALAPVAAIILAAMTVPARADDPVRAPVHKVTQSDSYVMMDPLYATVIDASRPCGMLMVAFGLDIPDADLRAKAERILPVLRDRYVRSLIGSTAEAEDLAQEAFLRLYASLLQSQAVGNVRSWIFRVAHNLAIDHLRRTSHLEQAVPEVWDVHDERPDLSPSAEQKLIKGIFIIAIRRRCVRTSCAARSCATSGGSSSSQKSCEWLCARLAPAARPSLTSA